MAIVFYCRCCQDNALTTIHRHYTPTMADVIAFRRPTLKEKHRGNTLCRHGHHKWELDTARQFDVKRGKLITAYRCSRCGKLKVKGQ